jgi:hypothetical protein
MSIGQAQERAIRQLPALRRDLSAQEQDSRNGRCPQCHKRLRWRRPRYRRSDGRPVDWINAFGGHHFPGLLLRAAGVAGAECRRCGQQWPVFATDESVIVADQDHPQ